MLGQVYGKCYDDDDDDDNDDDDDDDDDHEFLLYPGQAAVMAEIGALVGFEPSGEIATTCEQQAIVYSSVLTIGRIVLPSNFILL